MITFLYINFVQPLVIPFSVEVFNLICPFSEKTQTNVVEVAIKDWMLAQFKNKYIYFCQC